MPSSQRAQSAATAARSKVDAVDPVQCTPKTTDEATSRLDLSWLGQNSRRLIGVGVSTSDDDAGERLTAAGGLGDARGELENDGSLSDGTEDMGNGCDDS